MARFFLHVHDEVIAPDEEGLELPDLQAAREAALDGARDLVCEQIRRGYLNLDHRIEIEDEDGKLVMTIRFGGAFEMRR